jgi:hypothetical protein
MSLGEKESFEGFKHLRITRRILLANLVDQAQDVWCRWVATQEANDRVQAKRGHRGMILSDGEMGHAHQSPLEKTHGLVFLSDLSPERDTMKGENQEKLGRNKQKRTAVKHKLAIRSKYYNSS